MIRGDRVTLRPIEEGDIAQLRAWQSDPSVMIGWAIPAPLVPSNAFEDDLRGRFSSFEDAAFLIIEAEDRPIGRVDFEQLDARHGSVEIALYIGDASAQGRGHASDAVRTLARFLFEQRSVHRIELTVIASNDRARLLYESVGFTAEGILRDNVCFDGRFHDEILMALHAGSLRSSSRDRRNMRTKDAV
jgi:ribosomal-protein-alanine N-acetyltransferase